MEKDVKLDEEQKMYVDRIEKEFTARTKHKTTVRVFKNEYLCEPSFGEYMTFEIQCNNFITTVVCNQHELSQSAQSFYLVLRRLGDDMLRNLIIEGAKLS